ncbi:putative amidohydrolase [Bradyrhizobium sp. USDA 326]|uniref:metallophosphoesterase family protein n=1 Tax=unclassified Bradyrhizobium TaxID=2631580 RepID=UPI003515C00D
MSEISQQRVYSVAVISDIHAYTASSIAADATPPSWVTQAEVSRNRNPLRDLEEYVSAHKIEVDLLLCPGDFSDKADVSGLEYAWDKLQSIARAMKCKLLIGAAGNHDLHSRAAGSDPTRVSPSPHAKIRDLIPRFPLPNEAECLRYWSDQIAQYADSHCQVITLNSCASHGYIFESSDEYTKGRFSEEAEAKLLELVEQSTPRPINILLTHHHPQTITDLTFTDGSRMVRGDRLLNILGSGKYGSWMVIHGHRHVPHFHAASGDTDRAYVFSAGSVGVILSTHFYPSRPPNQFYVLQFDLQEIESRGTGIFGRVNAWNWNLGIGWHPAGENDPIPAQSGFGNRLPASFLADQVASLMKSRASESGGDVIMLEDDIAKAYPDVAFLLPSEREKFRDCLEQKGISVGRSPREKTKLLFACTHADEGGT